MFTLAKKIKESMALSDNQQQANRKHCKTIGNYPISISHKNMSHKS